MDGSGKTLDAEGGTGGGGIEDKPFVELLFLLARGPVGTFW